jgi:signal transduction histidine kinase
VLTTGLAWLKENCSSKLVQHTVVSAAARVMGNILSHESTALRLLKQMRQETALQAIDNFSSEITARFEAIGRTVEISTEGLATIPASSTVFISADIVSACFSNVLDNLLKYAFPDDSTSAKVGIFVEQHRNENNESMLSLCVKNNGKEIISAATMGSGGQRAASDLKLFGGQYFPPLGTEEHPWRVIHRMEFPLW